MRISKMMHTGLIRKYILRFNLFICFMGSIFIVNEVCAQTSYNGTVTYNPPSGTDGCVYNVDVSIILKAAGNYVSVKYDYKIVSVSAIIHSGKKFNADQLPKSVISYHVNRPVWAALPAKFTINIESNLLNWSTSFGSSIGVPQFLGEKASHETSEIESQNNRARSLVNNGIVKITNVAIDGPIQYDRTPLAEYFAAQEKNKPSTEK